MADHLVPKLRREDLGPAAGPQVRRVASREHLVVELLRVGPVAAPRRLELVDRRVRALLAGGAPRGVALKR